jgi:hypothetical protein
VTVIEGLAIAEHVATKLLQKARRPGHSAPHEQDTFQGQAQALGGVDRVHLVLGLAIRLHNNNTSASVVPSYFDLKGSAW